MFYVRFSLRLKDLRSAVIRLMEVARALKARRTSGGALTLDAVEVQIQMGSGSEQSAAGGAESSAANIEALVPKQSLEIHDTIAECMIFANHWVAKKIAQAFPNQALVSFICVLGCNHFGGGKSYL